MNRKTIILGVAFFVILIILILILSSRNNTNQTDNTKTEQIKLIWWNLFEPEENVKSIIDSYTALNPNITIQYQQVGTGTESIESYKARIINELSDQDILTSPDIFPISNGWAGSFENLTVSSPTSIFTTTDLTDLYSIIKKDFYKNGKLMAMPLYLDGLAVIYNKDRLKEQNLTVPNKYWSDFQTEAQMLTVKDKDGKIIKPGFSAYYYDNSQFSFDTFNLLLLQQGVEIFDSKGIRVKLENQPKAQEVIDFYNVFVNNTVKTWDQDQKSDIVQFLEGKLAMYIAPTWRIINILNYNEQYNLNLNIGVAKVPQLAAKAEMSWPMYWGQTVSKDCRYPSEAWKFIKYLTQAEQLKKLNENIISNGRPIGIIYPRLSMTKLIENDPYIGVYATSLLNASDWNMYDHDLMKKAFSKAVSEGLDVKKLDNAIDSVIYLKNITPTVTPTKVN